MCRPGRRPLRRWLALPRSQPPPRRSLQLALRHLKKLPWVPKSDAAVARRCCVLGGSVQSLMGFGCRLRLLPGARAGVFWSCGHFAALAVLTLSLTKPHWAEQLRGRPTPHHHRLHL